LVGHVFEMKRVFIKIYTTVIADHMMSMTLIYFSHHSPEEPR